MKRKYQYALFLLSAAVCAGLLIAFPFGWPPPVARQGGIKDGIKDKGGNVPPEVRGDHDAREALARGDYRLLSEPERKGGEWQEEYRDLLKLKMGVVLVPPEKASDGRAYAEYAKKQKLYINAWNDVVATKLRRQFGKHCLELLQTEAQLRYRQKSETTAKAEAIARAKGVADAQEAIANERMILREYHFRGFFPDWHRDYVELLEEKCGCRHSTADQAPRSLEYYAELIGWNETITAELRRRFGATILNDLEKEADQRWRARLLKK